MISDAVFQYAKILEALPSITPPTNVGKHSPFKEVAPLVYECSDGFGPAYGKPFSKGGQYVTLSDLKMLYLLGTEYAKQKLYGNKAHYRQSLNLNKLAALAYSKGDIIRGANGEKIVRNGKSVTGYHTSIDPETSIGKEYWTRIQPTYSLSASVCSMPYYKSYTKTKLDIVLPFLKESFSNITQTYTVPFDVVYSGIYIFPERQGFCADDMSIYYLITRDQPRQLLPISGELEISISQFEDANTNQAHINSLIPIYKYIAAKEFTFEKVTDIYQEEVLSWKPVIKDGAIIGEVPKEIKKTKIGEHKEIIKRTTSLEERYTDYLPLSQGRWYLYFKYTNATVTQSTTTTQDVFFPYVRWLRTMHWPSIY